MSDVEVQANADGNDATGTGSDHGSDTGTETAKDSPAGQKSSGQKSSGQKSTVEGPSRFVNPVLWREARTRFDSRRVGWLVFAYLILLGIIISLFYLSETNDPYSGPVVTRFGSIGRTVFESSLLTTSVLLMLLVPPQAASSITGERERQTLMPIQITLMRPYQIVLGKLGSSLIWTALLIILTGPLLALSYMIGGVTILNVLAGVAMLLLIAALTTSIAVWWSATVRRSSTAIVLTLLTLVALVAGTAMIYEGFIIIDEARGNTPGNGPEFVLAANPVTALASAVGQSDQIQEFNEFGEVVSSSPLSNIKRVLFQQQIGTSSYEEMTRQEAELWFGVPPTFPGVASTTTSDSTTGDTSATTSDSSEAASDTTSDSSTDDSSDVSETEMVWVDTYNGQIIDPDRVNAAQHMFPLFAKFIIFSALMIALTVWGASRRLRTPAKKER